jgi:hypothetical protein
MSDDKYIRCLRRGEARINDRLVASHTIHEDVCLKKEFKPTSSKCARCAKNRGTTIQALRIESATALTGRA